MQRVGKYFVHVRAEEKDRRWIAYGIAQLAPGEVDDEEGKTIAAADASRKTAERAALGAIEDWARGR